MAYDFPEPEQYRAASRALTRLTRACTLCPRRCGVDRTAGERGFCRAGRAAVVNISQLHFGEEPCISGTRGSGTVFFAGCTLACRFCQNWRISQEGGGQEMEAPELARVFLELEQKGAHNLNLVTATPHLPVILEALALAREEGLSLPVVYNTSGYERAAVMRGLEGLVDVYLPDWKYADDNVAERLSGGPDYVDSARSAIGEMLRQVGHLKLDDEGLAERGVLVRHLVLPGGLSGTPQVLEWLAELGGPRLWVSLMSQYTPMHRAAEIPELAAPLGPEEYRAAVEYLTAAGLTEGYVQELESVGEDLVPHFK